MIVTCSNCDRVIEFDRDKIEPKSRIVNGIKIKERWLVCEGCGTKYCVEVKTR